MSEVKRGETDMSENEIEIEREKNTEASGREPCGAVVVDKEAGMTSFAVVKCMRHIFGVKSVGHTGTLDPDATGVLVMLVGRAVKAASYVTVTKKRYTACLKLGVRTDTEDMSGKVISIANSLPSDGEVERAVSRFRGEYMQVPPMYSAVKMGGQKLVNLARRGITVDRAPRRVEIYSIEIIGTEGYGEYVLDVSCSSGTYIRTLCADIGFSLGCGGCMKWLRRTEVGNFTLADAHTTQEISENPLGFIIPTEELFTEIPKINFSRGDALTLFTGGTLGVGEDDIVRAPGSPASEGARAHELCGLYSDGKFFALGRVNKGTAKTVKLFTINPDEI
ncbi:MAG: tRNA pseudouridine(55) synthase TruB [Firmicutes bacterium]|nr:tRNA pseudouridine(55) synthase TruB [Bacillota bacterium]